MTDGGLKYHTSIIILYVKPIVRLWSFDTAYSAGLLAETLRPRSVIPAGLRN